MRSDGNNFNYFFQNELTELANGVQYKRMLMFCLEDWGRGLEPLGPLVYATAFPGGKKMLNTDNSRFQVPTRGRAASAAP